MEEDTAAAHHADSCPTHEKFSKLEQEMNELRQMLQLSAVYGKDLLEQNENLKQQIKSLQSLQEVNHSGVIC